VGVGRNLETVLLALGLLMVIGVGAGGYALWQNPRAHGILTFVFDAATLGLESNASPAGRALLKAGCQSTIIGEWRRIRGVVPIVRDGTGSDGLADDTIVVYCKRRWQATGPDCNEAHAAYVATADEPPARIALAIEKANGTRVCDGFYGPDGTRDGDFLEFHSATDDGADATCPPQDPAPDGPPGG
jgi:hypothetical protein